MKKLLNSFIALSLCLILIMSVSLDVFACDTASQDYKLLGYFTGYISGNNATAIMTDGTHDTTTKIASAMTADKMGTNKTIENVSAPQGIPNLGANAIKATAVGSGDGQGADVNNSTNGFLDCLGLHFSTSKSSFTTLQIPSDTSYKQVVYEFDVMFETDASSVTVTYRSSEKTKALAAVIAATPAVKDSVIAYTGSAGTNLSKTIKGSEYIPAFYGNVGINRWKRIRVSFPVNGDGNEPIRIYEGNTEVAQQKVLKAADNTELTGGYLAYIKGMTNTDKNVSLRFFAYGNTTNISDIANISFYATKTNDGIKKIIQDQDIYASVRADDGVTVDESTKTITVPSGSTVSDIKTNKLSVGTNDRKIGIYNSTLTTSKLDIAAVEEGDVFVVAVKGNHNNASYTGLHSYYTIKVKEPSFEVSDLSITPNTGSATVSFKYDNTLEEKSIQVILAAYGSDGRLLCAIPQSVTVPLGAEILTTDAYTLPSSISSVPIAKLRAFAFDSLTEIAPYCEAAVNP